MITKKELNFWIENKLNVLLKGKHGVGKTTMIIEAFEEAGIKWKYFSAATMDPWVDFIGIPKEKIEGDKSYLELVRPKAFAEDDVEALFFDEYNRAPKKVRNSVMELIQFKSINGRPFKNLKMVWAAINPDDDDEETYDVDMLDPAQLDRFQVHVEVPYKPNYYYFSNKFGTDTASKAIEWWNSQSEVAKNLVSPRRLDYAIEMFNNNGKVEHIIPAASNVSQFKKLMDSIALEAEYKKLQSLSTDEEKTALLGDESFYERIYPFLQEKREEVKWMKYLPKEKISTIVSEDTSKVQYLLKTENEISVFKEVLDGIAEAGLNTVNTELINKARSSSLEEALEEVMGDVVWGVQLDRNWPDRFVQVISHTENGIHIQPAWTHASTTAYREMCNNYDVFNTYSDPLSWKTYKSIGATDEKGTRIWLPKVSTTGQRKSSLKHLHSVFFNYSAPQYPLNFFRSALHTIAGLINGSQKGTIIKRIANNRYIPYIFNLSLDKILEHDDQYFEKSSTDLMSYQTEMNILFKTLREKPELKKLLRDIGFCF